MFNTRLQQAIEAHFDSVKDFAKALEAAGHRGASYSQVRRYLSGRTEKAPPLEFVEAAAEALKVRPAWLAFGDGLMTVAMETAVEELNAAWREGAKRLRRANAQRLGVTGRDDLSQFWELFHDAVFPFARVSGREDGAGEVYLEFADVIASPLAKAGVDTDRVPPDAYRHYLTLVTMALQFVFEAVETAEQGRAGT